MLQVLRVCNTCFSDLDSNREGRLIDTKLFAFFCFFYFLTLQLGNDINKEALAIKTQIRQIIREVGEVIAHTQFNILANMTIQA